MQIGDRTPSVGTYRKEPGPSVANDGSLQSSLATQQLLVLATSQMGLGWTMSFNVSIGPGASGTPSRVGVALIHPDRGIALVDVAPASTRDAVLRLRRALVAAKFLLIFAGHIPVVYRQLTQEDIPRLGAVIEAAFAEEQPISLHGGHAWTGLARRVLGGEHCLDLKPSIQREEMHAPPTPQPGSTEPRPAPYPSGLRSLGYFWLAVVAVLALGAAFLQYTYIPPARAGSEPNQLSRNGLR